MQIAANGIRLWFDVDGAAPVPDGNAMRVGGFRRVGGDEVADITGRSFGSDRSFSASPERLTLGDGGNGPVFTSYG